MLKKIINMKTFEKKYPGMRLLFLFLVMALVCIACEKDDDIETETTVVIDDTDFEATGWTTATHSKDAEPDFDEVFEDNTIKRIDIVIREDR